MSAEGATPAVVDLYDRPAVVKVLDAGHRTPDIARGNVAGQTNVSTQEMGKLVHQALSDTINRSQSLHGV